MRKKTIGEVLRLARINQGLSLDELQKKTEIQLDMLEAMEADDFDQLQSPFYIDIVHYHDVNYKVKK